MMNTTLMKLASNPAVRVAVEEAVRETLTTTAVQAYDHLMDRIAYKIAKDIYEKEQREGR